MSPAPVSVLVPTLGRPTLADCLRSLAACRPRAAEVIVAVQGPADEVERLVTAVGLPDARVLVDPGRGVASSTNLGIRSATHAIVAVTHDDCTVAPDWIAVAARLGQRHPDAVLTGRVLPAGDPARVPSCKTDEIPQDFTGGIEPGSLYPANAVLPRDHVIGFGGFDERFGPAEPAEDCDFAYRWLRSGRRLRFEPELVVRHHDWRTDEELGQLHRRYGYGIGTVYGKQLRAGDLRVLRLVARDLRSILGTLRRPLRREPSPRWDLCFAAGFGPGLVHGVRRFGVRRPDVSARGVPSPGAQAPPAAPAPGAGPPPA